MDPTESKRPRRHGESVTVRAAFYGSLSLAAVALGVAMYLFGWCVPLESACHMGAAEACERLERTLRAAGWTATGAIACLLAAVIARRRAAR